MSRDGSEFERVVLPHLDAAYALARWLMRDGVAAEDVVQEAMLRALRFHGGLRGDAKPWLLQIVRHVAYSAMAARGREEPLAEDVLPLVEPSADPERALDAVQEGERLERALAGLPAEMRECLVLRELEGMSYKEIAVVVGAPIGTVMSRLFRARQMLLGAGA